MIGDKPYKNYPKPPLHEVGNCSPETTCSTQKHSVTLLLGETDQATKAKDCKKMTRQIPEDSYVRDKDETFLAIGAEWTDKFSLPEYHRDMDWQEFPIIAKNFPHNYEVAGRIEHEIRKSQTEIETTSTIITKACGMQQLKQKRTFIGKGKILCRWNWADLSNQYHRWPLSLNIKRERLHLPGTKEFIDRRNLIMLYLFLNGYPRKSIGVQQHCSVKAIEKRLARIKEILTPKDRSYHNLHHALRAWNLVEFILAAPSGDWFSIKR